MGYWTPTGVEPTDYDDDDDPIIEIVCTLKFNLGVILTPNP